MKHLLVTHKNDVVSKRWVETVTKALETADQGAEIVTIPVDSAPDSLVSYDSLLLSWPDWDLESVVLDDGVVAKWRAVIGEVPTAVLPSHRGYADAKEKESGAEVFFSYPYDTGRVKELTEIQEPSAVLTSYPFYEWGASDPVRGSTRVRERLLAGRTEKKIVAFSPSKRHVGSEWPNYDKYFDSRGNGLYYEIEDARVLERYHIRYPETVMYTAKEDWDRFEGTAARAEWERVGILMAEIDEQSLLAAADVAWIVGQLDERVFTVLDSVTSRPPGERAGRGAVWSGSWLSTVDSAREDELPTVFRDQQCRLPPEIAQTKISEIALESPRLYSKNLLVSELLSNYAVGFVPPNARRLVYFDLFMEGLVSSVRVSDEEGSWRSRAERAAAVDQENFYSVEAAVSAWVAHVAKPR